MLVTFPQLLYIQAFLLAKKSTQQNNKQNRSIILIFTWNSTDSKGGREGCEIFIAFAFM